VFAVPVGAHDERVTGTGPGDPRLLAARDAARLRRLYGRGRVSGDWAGFAAAAREQRAELERYITGLYEAALPGSRTRRRGHRRNRLNAGPARESGVVLAVVVDLDGVLRR